MSLPELPARLRAIAEWVVPGAVLADLCCDHALLAATLVATGRIPRAIAGDLHDGPLAAAGETLAAAGIGDRVELRQGDGAELLGPGEATTVVLAGIGALLAERILARAREGGTLAGVERLIVQVNHGFPKLAGLRRRMAELGWEITDERLVRDPPAGGRIYVIMAAEEAPAGARQGLDPLDGCLGPILRWGREPLWPAYLEQERARIRRALAGMEQARTPPAQRQAHADYLAALDDSARRASISSRSLLSPTRPRWTWRI